MLKSGIYLAKILAVQWSLDALRDETCLALKLSVRDQDEKMPQCSGAVPPRASVCRGFGIRGDREGIDQSWADVEVSFVARRIAGSLAGHRVPSGGGDDETTRLRPYD